MLKSSQPFHKGNDQAMKYMLFCIFTPKFCTLGTSFLKFLYPIKEKKINEKIIPSSFL